MGKDQLKITLKKTNKPYHNYRVEDFLADESFIDWVKGRKGQVAWQEIFEQHPDLVPIAEEAGKIIRQLKFSEPKTNEDRIAKLQQQIHERIGDSGKKSKEANVVALHQRNIPYQPERSNSWKWMAAAMAGIIVFLGLLVWRQSPDVEPEKLSVAYVTKATKKGQKLTTRLSDGTIVTLNADSKIHFEEVFNDTARYVTLTGEAFFDVAKDIRPFRVKSNGTVTTALGTSFNIKQKEEKVSISLVTGKVGVNMVSQNGMEESTLLIPGEQVAVEVKDQISFVKGKFDIADVLAWKRGVLAFRQVNSNEVWKELENWYGVEIKVKDRKILHQDWNYTGSFDNESLENVLESIGFVKGFEFEIKGEQVIIY
ncbi:FecR family protein [Echinicola sediminis]